MSYRRSNQCCHRESGKQRWPSLARRHPRYRKLRYLGRPQTYRNKPLSVFMLTSLRNDNIPVLEKLSKSRPEVGVRDSLICFLRDIELVTRNWRAFCTLAILFQASCELWEQDFHTDPREVGMSNKRMVGMQLQQGSVAR